MVAARSLPTPWMPRRNRGSRLSYHLEVSCICPTPASIKQFCCWPYANKRYSATNGERAHLFARGILSWYTIPLVLSFVLPSLSLAPPSKVASASPTTLSSHHSRYRADAPALSLSLASSNTPRKTTAGIAGLAFYLLVFVEARNRHMEDTGTSRKSTCARNSLSSSALLVKKSPVPRLASDIARIWEIGRPCRANSSGPF